ncbi:hypothetical protein QE364_001612 [Nocardioides zeae]|uniref:Uncharacterized protein n=1 Tax=Nocardioides zeae TaxID=1457234 RepID=A0ACC6IGX7_9ACTN|nr:hypothetical protein [Nocardioides zeae]MDR6172911.1 hypothetical protein [Nocardioides zeae]MDR6209905.1 hypothetical protein [Nocardioides zeae]
MRPSSTARRLLLASALVLPATTSGAVLPLGPAAAAEADTQLVLPADAPAVEGTDAGAPTTLPRGWSRTTLGGDGATGYFEVRREQEGSTVHVAAVTPGAGPDSAESLSVEVSTAAEDYCTQASGSRTEDELGLVTASTVVGPADPTLDTSGDAADEPCVDASTLQVELSRGASAGSASTEVWFRVVEESPATDVEGLPEPAEAERGQVDVSGEPQDRPGGRDVADAPLVGDGIWRGTVPAGGQVAYRVAVAEGQTLRAEVVSPALSGDQATELGYGTDISLVLLDPMLSADRTLGDDGSLGSEPARAQAAAGPVLHRNRFDSFNGPYLPGEYLVVVAMDPVDLDGLDDVGYTLRLGVEGEPTTVAHSVEPPFLAGGAATDAVPLGAPAAADDEASSTVQYVAGGALVAVGLVLAAGGGLLVRRQAVSRR